MPNTNRIISPYIVDGNPDTMNVPSLYAPGDLGAAFDYNKRAYQVVQVDSGATSATPIGVVVANQLAFWKQKEGKYIVTNDDRVAIGGGGAAQGGAVGAFRNQVAGIFRNNATAGNFVCILQRGEYIPVSSEAAGGIGQHAIAMTTGTAKVTHEALGTAPTYQSIGVERGAAVAHIALTAIIYVDVDIPNIP